MRLGVTRRIVLGLAVILVIGLGCLAVIYDGLVAVREAMARLARVKEPANAAAYEMEIQVHTIGASLLHYLDTGDLGARQEIAGAAGRFEAFHRAFLTLTGSREAQGLGDELRARYSELTTAATELMTRRDAREELYGSIARSFEAMDDVITHRIRAAADPFALALHPSRVPAFAHLEAEIAEMGLWLANYQRMPRAEYRSRVFDKEREVRAALRRLRALDTTREERHALRVVEQTFERTMVAVRQLVDQNRDLRDRVAAFVGKQRALDALLDNQVQALTLRELQAPSEEADRAAAAILGRVRFLVPVYIVATLTVAVVLATTVIRPLRRLRRGTEAIASGDLSHRVAHAGRNEFGDLATAFNQMVEQLDRTTVSKARLEASERTLQETVAHLRQEIGERERAEQEQVRLTTALQRAETMSAMGRLVSAVAHEVRNPLFGISSVVDAMEARLGERPEITRYTAVMRSQVARMTGLMQELLDFGRPVPVAMVPGMVAEAVREAIEVCEPLAERLGVRFELRLDAAGGHGMMDRARLVQVFKNVLENAVQHSSAGGAVQVDGRETTDEHGAPWFECLIADSGPGFRPEDLSRIFEPFFTRRRGGTGLGLSIVQRVAEGHGGTVAASNRPGGGAAVTVRLPLLAGSAPSGDAARGG